MWLGKDFIERLLEEPAVEGVVDTDVLAAVVYPEVHDAGVSLGLTHGVGDVAATASMLYPETAYALIGVGEGEAAALGMGETGGVEVQFGVVLPGPLYPALEIIDRHLVPIYHLPLEVSVYLMQVEAVLTGYQALGLEDVLTQFVDVARRTGKVARALYAAAHGSGLYLKSLHIICLPAMQRQMEIL